MAHAELSRLLDDIKSLEPRDLRKVEQVVKEQLDRSARNDAITEPTVGQEIVTAWLDAGVIGSRPEIMDSQSHARKLRDQAQRRGRAS
jgi:hypothetical protein